MQPDKTSIYETKRSSDELKTIGVKNIELIVNGILPEEVCESVFFKKRYEMQQKYLKKIDEIFPVPKKHVYQRDGEIKGIARLKNISSSLYEYGRDLTGFSFTHGSGSALKTGFYTLDSESVMDLIAPQDRTKSIFFTGKGGVGKTTVSCVTAFHLAAKGHKTLLLTTDPASHIGEVLEQMGEELLMNPTVRECFQAQEELLRMLRELNALISCGPGFDFAATVSPKSGCC